MNKAKREQILKLLKSEVVPAIGCTEPVAVALAVAKACEILQSLPQKIVVYLSANVFKNAMGVGIPGTDMTGLFIAIALGAISGKSEYKLEVLRDITVDDVEAGKRMIEEKRIEIRLKEHIEEKLYIEACCETESEKSCAIIASQHANFVFLSHNDSVLLDKRQISSSDSAVEIPDLSLRTVYDFATTATFEEIRFILESGKMNKAIAEISLQGAYGHQLGRLLKEKFDKGFLRDSVYTRILSYTSAACDARMAGAKIPVMSNSGSGNQGISATLPVVIYAEENNKSEEELARALVLSHLTAIYIKIKLGRLAALCGCVVAATGSSCGITWLMGGSYEQICFAVKNMIANLTGMVCDGAKPSCSLKVTSGVSTAVFSALMAIENRYVTSVEGIIEDDIDRCINNLARIGSVGMNETDRLVLEIMTHKC